MSTDVNLFRADVGPTNDLLTSLKSVWTATAYPTIESMALAANVRVSVSPKTIGNSYGTQYIFEINQQMPEISRINAEVTCSAITYTGGTYLYIVDDFVSRIFQNIEYKDPNYGTLQTYAPDWAVTEYRKLTYAQQQQTQLEYLYNLTDGARSTLAAAGFSFTYELPSWFRERLENTLRCQNIDVPMQIVLSINALNSLVATDGTNPTGTITINLTFCGRIPTEAERNTTAAIINSPDGQLMQIRDYFYQEYANIPQGTIGAFTVPIDAIKGPVWCLDFYFRAYSDVHGNTGSPLTNNYTNFDPTYKPLSIQIQTGNENVLQQINTVQLTLDERRIRYPDSVPEQDVVRVNLCEFPQSANCTNTSYLDFNYLGKPVAILNFLTATPVAISFGVGAQTNVFLQHQGGTMRAVTSQ